MKPLLLLFILFCTAKGLAQPATGCHLFKSGQFVYKDDSGVSIKITRTATRQTETNEQTGLVTKSKISWLNDCNYTLKQIWANSRKSRKNNGSTRTITITKHAGNSYEYSCNCGDASQTTITGTVIKTGE